MHFRDWRVTSSLFRATHMGSQLQLLCAEPGTISASASCSLQSPCSQTFPHHGLPSARLSCLLLLFFLAIHISAQSLKFVLQCAFEQILSLTSFPSWHFNSSCSSYQVILLTSVPCNRPPRIHGPTPFYLI